MNPLMLQAELAQLRRQFQALALDREQWIRLTACLANLIRLKDDAKIVNGNVAVDLADYEAVPTMWELGIEQMNVKEADAPDDDKGVDVILVKVTMKTKGPTNGHVLAAPSKPASLILPEGV